MLAVNKITFIKSTGLATQQLIARDPKMSLILDVQEEDALIFQASKSLLALLPEFKAVNNITEKANVGQLMSAIMVFAYLKRITIKEALLTIKPIGQSDIEQMLNWTNMDSSTKLGKCRLRDSTLTANEFKILKEDQRLTDNVSIHNLDQAINTLIHINLVIVIPLTTLCRGTGPSIL